jgi:hypothetical protein
VQVQALNAENSDQVLATEDSPKYTPVDEVVLLSNINIRIPITQQKVGDPPYSI